MMASLTSLNSFPHAVFMLLLLHFSLPAIALEEKNGFDLSNAIIDTDEILFGGPPRDGIPALHKPRFVIPQKADFMKADDRVIGITINGIARAYPIKILNWHEIVNDKIGDQAVAITYCPLCGTGVVFDAGSANAPMTFGVSGLLYNSDVLLYDHGSGSLWSQIIGQAVSGPRVREKLTMLPSTHTPWAQWLKDHPSTEVLSTETGYRRNYDRNPYAGYEESRQLYFSVRNWSPNRYHPKEIVLGIERNGQFKAYPFVELGKAGKKEFRDTFAGEELTIQWDRQNQVATIRDRQGKVIPGIQGFWFSWFAFHPETEVFQAGKRKS